MDDVDDTIKALCDQNIKLGKIVMRYRNILANLYQTIHTLIIINFDASKISQIHVMQIDKEEYERWQKAKSIIHEVWNQN